MRFEKAASWMASLVGWSLVWLLWLLCRLHVKFLEIWSTMEQQSWHGKVRHGLGEDRFLPKELKDQTTPHRPIIFANSSKLFFMIVLGTDLSGSLLMFLAGR